MSTYFALRTHLDPYCVQTVDQASVEHLASLLSAADPPIPHYLWIEQPNNVPTCLALAPNQRESKIVEALDKSGGRLWKG
ncbi:hypothetical protein DICSQDRAFT_74738 [Dichomitus squalens LYAD-421 SS1]|uniref:Uncharacterized protein n=1 Tax=Dichomitus squalens (strain LYAD-421) TaxID=732165 RepID=R7SJT6_DICSQ|nr:uncharacterized protein DICSQDRAFT_74738 [Dichomitus squalens LYAD-421 SS1]EJF55292.1 hypothetical protein DICSQDRAFT_74738 [Dichomitus squalens LYAD-421 SS1]